MKLYGFVVFQDIIDSKVVVANEEEVNRILDERKEEKERINLRGADLEKALDLLR